MYESNEHYIFSVKTETVRQFCIDDQTEFMQPEGIQAMQVRQNVVLTGDMHEANFF